MDSFAADTSFAETRLVPSGAKAIALASEAIASWARRLLESRSE
jgi:hypothetical protein